MQNKIPSVLSLIFRSYHWLTLWRLRWHRHKQGLSLQYLSMF